MRARLVSFAVTALAATALAPTLLASAARAHLGAPEGRVPFLEEGALVGGSTTWGIVLEDEQGWGRVCEEALGGPPGFVYRRVDGSIVIGRDDGLYLTSEGCSLTALEASFEDRRPVVGAPARAVPGRLFLATAHPDGDNGIYASDDGGATFEPTALTAEDVVFTTLAVSPLGERVFAAGTDVGPRTPAFFISADGGATFARSSPWPASTAFVRVVGTSEDGSRAALSLIDDAQPGSSLWSYLPEEDEAVLLGELPGVISDYLEADGAHLVIEGRQRFLRAAPGEAFVEVEGGPTRCLLRVADDERVWGCGQPFQEGHFLVSEDGLEWEPLLPFLAVEERRCPEGTLGAERCAYLFEGDAGPRPDAGGLPDAGPRARAERPGEEEPTGCSCAGTSSGGLVPLCVLVLLFGRLRRKPRKSAVSPDL